MFLVPIWMYWAVDKVTFYGPSIMMILEREKKGITSLYIQVKLKMNKNIKDQTSYMWQVDD